MRFKNKVAVITGGSSGIGASSAIAFAKEGASVYVLDNKTPSFLDCQENIYYIHCDVSDFDSNKNAILKIQEKQNQIDYLFANAGQHTFGNIEETSLDEFERILSINFKGIFYVLKCVLPIMREQNSGSIVLMGSDQSLVGKGKSAIYGATKGAIAQLAKSCAIDYSPFNIRINCVCPGTIETPLFENAIEKYVNKYGGESKQIYEAMENAQPIKRLGKPEEVANLVLFLSSGEASFITGALISVDGGYTAQ